MPVAHIYLRLTREFECTPELERRKGESPLEADMVYAEFLADEAVKEVTQAFHGEVSVDLDHMRMMTDAGEEVEVV